MVVTSGGLVAAAKFFRHMYLFNERVLKHSCVASSMCARTRQTLLPSIQHVCKDKERHHPHPMTGVASRMCARTRQTQLRSFQHVRKFKERHHSQHNPQKLQFHHEFALPAVS